MNEAMQNLETWDDFDKILQAGAIDATGIDFSPEMNPRQFIMRKSRTTTDIIHAQNRAWRKHYKDDHKQLRRWECRLHIFHLARRSIEYWLASEEGIDWGEVASDLGFMNAFRVASSNALHILKERAEQADQSGA